MPTKSIDLMALMERFHTEEACREVVAEIRWPAGVKCPRCEADRHAYDSQRFVWDCYSCGYQFSALSGTVFHDTKLPLRKWFMAVLLMAEARKGISANQMKRTIGVSYKTAWYLCHRIRSAMRADLADLLAGIVEVDETYVGGKIRGTRHKKWSDNKTMVLGAIQRGGAVRLRSGKRNNKPTLHGFIRSVVSDDAEAIHTDEWWAYKGIGDANTRHETVNHKQDEWVRADAHTNTVESVWSLFKRSIIGSYHQLSEKHLDAYLDEMAFRFNNRNNPYLFRDTLAALLAGKTLEYKDLIA
jgi:transposase-like protein